MSGALVAYEAACRAVAEARTVDEVKDVRDKAEAMRHYARQAKNRDLEIDAAEIRFLAERRLGELLLAQKKTFGFAQGRRSDLVPKENQVLDVKATLSEIGVDKKLSMRAQRLAAVPAAKFDALIADWRARVASETERVSLTLLREGEAELKRAPYEARIAEGATVDDLQALAKSGAKFGVIYADPPWAFETYSARGKERAAERHYDTADAGAIAALPVAQLAAKDCVLLLWATMPMLTQALDLIGAWGFAYKTCGFVWIKMNRLSRGRTENREGTFPGRRDDGVFFKGQGFWTRANAELCLLATTGAPKRLDKDVAQLIVEGLAEHSAKPLETRARIERLVAGPYLELYGRATAPGWTVWGNEIARATFQKDALLSRSGKAKKPVSLRRASAKAKPARRKACAS